MQQWGMRFLFIILLGVVLCAPASMASLTAQEYQDYIHEINAAANRSAPDAFISLPTASTTQVSPVSPIPAPTVKPKVPVVKPPTLSGRSLSRGMRGVDVVALQKKLISLLLLSSDSATGYFGPLTEAAVREFQERNGIVSSGTPSTTGYGTVGPKTRARLSITSPTTIDSRTSIQAPQPDSTSGSSGGTNSNTGTVRWYDWTNYGTTQTVANTNTTNTGTNTTNTPTSCSFNDQTIAHGASVTAYQASSVAYGSQCVSQSRTCSNGTLSGTYTASQCSVAPQTFGNISARLSAIEAQRARDWTRYGTSVWPYWEVVYDGVDSPSDNVPPHFQWDNPIDDDWFDPYYLGYGSYLDQFRLNTPSRGFMTVDRTYLNKNKNGNIYRRDEFLDSNTMHAVYGLTLEVKVKLLPQSQKDAFYINYVANDCTASVALSGATSQSAVGMISTGSIYGGNTNHVAFDTTTDFVTLRLVRAPSASTYSVYLVAYANEADPKPAHYTKLIEGACLTDWRVGSGPHVKYPYIQLGDNSGSSDSNAAFVLDFVRYRRDAYTPAESISSIQDRWPLNTLPPSVSSGGDAHLFGSGYFGSVSGGYLSNVPASADISRATGLTDMADVTVEIRAKVLPNHGARGWKFLYIDTLGGLSLYLSPDKVETGPGTKPVGILAHSMNTTDGYHTYRLVRKAGEIYAHLYVDNDPVPAIVDQRLSAETEARGYAANPYILWGPTTFYTAPFRWPVLSVESHVDIEFIRWYGYAFAPPSPQ